MEVTGLQPGLGVRNFNILASRLVALAAINTGHKAIVHSYTASLIARPSDVRNMSSINYWRAV